MNADFLLFDDQIINKRDIIRIYKCSTINKDANYGIRLVIRSVGEVMELYGNNPTRRNERFNILKGELC